MVIQTRTSDNSLTFPRTSLCERNFSQNKATWTLSYRDSPKILPGHSPFPSPPPRNIFPICHILSHWPPAVCCVDAVVSGFVKVILLQLNHCLVKQTVPFYCILISDQQILQPLVFECHKVQCNLKAKLHDKFVITKTDNLNIAIISLVCNINLAAR